MIGRIGLGLVVMGLVYSGVPGCGGGGPDGTTSATGGGAQGGGGLPVGALQTSGPTSTATAPLSPTTLTPTVSAVAAAAGGSASFQARCAALGVVKCVGFDALDDFAYGTGGANGAYGANSGIMPTLDANGTPDYARAARDTTMSASGASSLKFTVPGNSGSNTSGTWFTNFSSDLSLQFGENSEFFIQWRQRFSPEFLSTSYLDAGGWKQIIIGSGDTPGKIWSSCTALEVVATNLYHRGFPIMYNSCDGSASHGAYDGFYQPFGASDFKLQNGRPAPYCLYSQSGTGYFPPSGNCFAYVPNEWMTFQIRIKTGPRVGDEFVSSYVTLWAAREGRGSEPVIEWGPYNLSAGRPTDAQRFGKVWLLPYNTGKNPSQSHPTAYTWYDELVISRNRIADP